MQNNSVELVSHVRVVKKLAPTSRGAIRLRDQFGETLICVRHRVDARARFRFTTVELLVDRSAIKPKPQKLVGIRVDWNEQPLQEVVRAAGAKWDAKARLWRLPRRLVGILRLTDRVVEE